MGFLGVIVWPAVCLAVDGVAQLPKLCRPVQSAEKRRTPKVNTSSETRRYEAEAQQSSRNEIALQCFKESQLQSSRSRSCGFELVFGPTLLTTHA
eukprot:1114478-Pleurochrysis_carterae.AAC.1